MSHSVPLSDIAEINPPPPHLPANDEPVSFLPMAAVANDGRGFRPEARSYADVAKGYTPFASGDVLIAKITPCFENGKVAFIDNLPHRIGFGSTEFHVLRPRHDVDGRYLFHMLRSPRFRHDAETRMTGSAGQQRVPAQFLRDYELPRPPLPQQRRIAAILDKADAIRAKRREALAQADALLRSSFLDLFGDPVANPKGWEELRLDLIANIRSGITKGRKTNGEPLRAVPYMRVANVQDGHIGLSDIKTIDASEAEIARFALRPGDILLTEGGDPDKLGRGAVWHGEIGECIHQNHIFVVRLRESGLSPEYASALLSSARGKQYFLRSAKQTTGIASINRTQLAAFPMLLPDRAIHDRWLEANAAANAVKKRLAHLAVDADALYASLAQRAFRREFSGR